jgi:Flp pilus assembly protein TadG
MARLLQRLLRFRRFHRREDGQALVMVVFAMLTIMAVAMVVVDGGHAFVEKRSLQNAVDAAALAAAGKLPTNGSACTGACLVSVETTAEQYLAYNGAMVTLNYSPTCATDTLVADTGCYQTPYKGDSGLVLIKLIRTFSTFFGGAVGVPRIDVSARAASKATPVTGATTYPGLTTPGTTQYFTNTSVSINNGTTSYVTSTTASTNVGTTTPATTVYSTSASTTTSTTAGTPQAIFAYTHGGTDPCGTSTGVVMGGNPADNVDAVISNGSINVIGSGTLKYAGYGPNCSLNVSGGGSVIASQKNNPAPKDWPVFLTAAQRAAICALAPAAHNTTTALSVTGDGIWCSTQSVTLSLTNTSLHVTLIAPVVTLPGTSNHLTLNPATGQTLTIWQYDKGSGPSVDFTFTGQNSGINGVLWIQNGDLIYGGNSGSTGFYEAQNVTLNGNSYQMVGSGASVGGTTSTSTSTTVTPVTTITGTTTGGSVSTSVSTSTSIVNGTTSTTLSTTPVTIVGTTRASSTVISTTGTTVGLGE